MNITEEKIKEMEERLAVMKAFLEGKQIQFQCRTTREPGVWLTSQSNPSWDWVEYDYRVKKTPREVVIVESDSIDQSTCWAHPKNAVEAILRNNPGMKLVKFREVLED